MFTAVLYLDWHMHLSVYKGKLFVAPVVAGTENMTALTLLIVLVLSPALIPLQRRTLPQNTHSFVFLSLD